MATVYQFGNAQLRPEQRRLLIGGNDSRIGARAFDLLLALVERRDRTVTKNELLDSVWPDAVVEENNLHVHVSTLRKVLGPQVIVTIPGRGYRFTASLVGAVDGATNAAMPEPVPAPTSSAAVALLTNLPAELPSLYGRADDVPALRTLLESHKLVTVVGAGGIGKTALAQTVAHQLRGSLDGGVWLVELAPVVDPSQVVATVAHVLRVTLDTVTPVETLARALGKSRMLIVLDNCEHLLHAVAEMAAALHLASPNVRLLATSQEPLKLAQECLYRLDPLALPDEAGVDSARQAGAVALFEARARAADPRFALSEHNVAAVVDICRHLDGIALAIELAAARVPLLGVDGLRARLDDRFRVLTGGARLALRRHQTLRAALDWSYGLLTPEEQTVFRRLGVFVGSFGLECAQRAAADDRIDGWGVLDRLGALVDKSLVAAETGEEPRYRLRETSRAFALEKLQQAGETEDTMRSHAVAMLAVFEGSHENEYVLSMQARLERYLPDLDNARAALDWSANASGYADLHIALAGAIAWIWFDAGLRFEGLRRMELAMAMVGLSTAPRLEARVLGSWSRMTFPETGPQVLAAAARGVEILRTLGDPRALFAALCHQGISLAHCHQLDEAEIALQEAERIYETCWPPRLRAPLLIGHGRVLDRRARFEEGAAVNEELLRLATTLDDKKLVVTALIALEQSAAALGHLEESVARGRELLRLIRQEPFLRSGLENIVFGNLSLSLTKLGEIDEALELARCAYQSIEQAGHVLCILDFCAFLAFKRGHVDDAARILGRTDMRYSTGTAQRQTVEQKLYDGLILDLRGTLSGVELSRLMKEGEALSDEDGARLALRD